MMDNLLYILEANLYLAIFALFYFFALRKEKHYLANRVVLISSFFLAWLIPGLSIIDPVSSVLPTIGLESITISPNSLADSPTVLSFSFEVVIVTVYCLGVIVGFLVFFARLMRILAVSGNDSKIVDQRLKIVDTDSVGAWSFFNLIALGKDIPLENRDWIMEHEKVHAAEKHSIDKLLIQVVKIFGWFNPAVYYFEFALEENHEFRADQVVCEKFSDSLVYSQVLISQSLSGVPFNLLGHSFSKKSLLKTRIQMINQTKQTGKMKYLLTLPVLAVALLFHNGTKADVQSESASTPQRSVIIAQKGGDEVYKVVDKMPEFKGGLEGLFKFISNNTVYPKSSSKSDESGKVFVQFIIDENGNVVDPKVIDAKSVKSNSLRRAALETVAKMPAWTPGEHEGKKVKVQLTLPIQFELE